MTMKSVFAVNAVRWSILLVVLGGVLCFALASDVDWRNDENGGGCKGRIGPDSYRHVGQRDTKIHHEQSSSTTQPAAETVPVTELKKPSDCKGKKEGELIPIGPVHIKIPTLVTAVACGANGELWIKHGDGEWKLEYPGDGDEIREASAKKPNLIAQEKTQPTPGK